MTGVPSAVSADVKDSFLDIAEANGMEMTDVPDGKDIGEVCCLPPLFPSSFVYIPVITFHSVVISKDSAKYRVFDISECSQDSNRKHRLLSIRLICHKKSIYWTIDI